MFEFGDVARGDDRGVILAFTFAVVLVSLAAPQPAAKRPRDAVTIRAAMFDFVMKLPLSEFAELRGTGTRPDFRKRSEAQWVSEAMPRSLLLQAERG
jgi:hypothetical protein